MKQSRSLLMSTVSWRGMFDAVAAAVTIALMVMVTARTTIASGPPATAMTPLESWRFDGPYIDGGTLRSANHGGTPAAIVGEPDIVSYEFGNALYLDGKSDSFLVTDDLTTVTLPRTALTVEAWVLDFRQRAWGGYIGVIQDNGSSESGWLLGSRGDRFCFAIATTGADDGDGALTYLSADTPYESGRWYHLVGTYDGKTQRLWVNGRLAAESDQQSGPILYPPAAFYEIGAYHDDNEYHRLEGKLLEVQVFDTAMPESDIVERSGRYAAATGIAREWIGDPAFVVAPYLQYGTAASMTVLWETNRPATTVLEWGETYPPQQVIRRADDAVMMHEVRIDGLQPATKYFYRARSVTADGVELDGGDGTFKTAVADDAPIGFVVIGDTQSNPEVWGQIAERAWGERPDFLVHCGDLVGTGSAKNHWVDEFFAPGRKLLARIPFYSVLGNHEQDADHYYRYMAHPEPEFRYTFRHGNAEFFMLDSNRDCGPDSEQFTWLDSELEQSDATWKFVVHHHPVYTSDSNDYGDAYKGDARLGDDRVRPLIPLYERHDVDIVFHGHIHDYERTWPIRNGRVDEERGVRYVQTGGAGGSLEDYAPTRSWFTAKVRRHHHYCTVAIHRGTLEFRAYSLGGRLFDFFDLRKSDEPAPGLRIRKTER